MSQYTNLFVKRGETVILLGSFSRNHTISQVIGDFAPYEALKRIGVAHLTEFRNRVEGLIKCAKDNRTELEAEIEDLRHTEGDLHERLELINDLRQAIRETYEDEDEQVYATHIFDFLRTILDDNHYWCADDTERCEVELLCGIEASETDPIKS